MNKRELIDRVTEQVDCPKKLVRRIIECSIEEIEEELSKGKRVQLVGFGSFDLRRKPGRQGRDPHTHQPLWIDESIHVGFKMGHRLKNLIKESDQ